MAQVNVPTDTKIKEKDINRKLQLYGIYEAFSNGKVPSNQQIDVALNSMLESKALKSPSGKLSSEGQKLVADLKEVIRQAKLLLLSKNEGNLLQEFIWDAQHLDGGSAKLPGAPIDKATARQHGNEAVEGLKTLGTLVLSNGQFRKLLNDTTILIRDMAGDAAQNAADKVNPSEDRLRQIDEPAEDNTWHDVPDLSRDNLRNQARATYDKNKPFNREQVQQAARDGANAAQSHSTQDNREAANVGVTQVAEDLKQRARQSIPDERQEDAKKAKSAAIQHTKNYMGKKMPQERRDQTIWRLKKMITEIQGHSDYQQAIETLLSLAETYGGHASTISNQSAGTVKGAHDDNSLRSAETNLKTLIERFANSTSSDDLFDALNQIYRDADQDPELKNWFKDLDRYIRKCLQEQGYVLQDASTEEWNRLYDKGRLLLRERYRNHTDRILDEFMFLGDQFDQDPQNRAFGDAVQKLFLDLGNDENGKPKFKKHLVKDLTEVIIPAIFENTRYVPVPRIEVSDPMIDVVVENLVIESDNLFPNQFEFGSDNYFRMGRRNKTSTRDNKITVACSGIQMDLRDVAYYIKKKQGFPSITDEGVMDIILAGDGFSFKLAARNAKKSDRQNFVVVEEVDVEVKNLSIKVKRSNHKLLFAIAKPLLLKVMKPAIQKILEKQIKDNFEKLDRLAYAVKQDVDKAMQAAKNDPKNAQNIYQSYVSALQRQITEKKKKAEKVTSKTDVKVAVTKEDSMFKHISLPGGISSKATEYKQLAAKGDRWESPVFGIGNAKTSNDIPKLKQITRKSHSTASSTLRGDNTQSTTSSVTGAGRYGNAPGSGGHLGGAPVSGLGSSGFSNGPTGATGQTAAGGPESRFINESSGATAGFGNQVDQAFAHQDATTGGISKPFYDTVTQR